MDLIITILPVASKDLPISPRCTRYEFLQLVSQWVEFYILTFPRFFRYGGMNTNHALVRIELTTSALLGVQVTY